MRSLTRPLVVIGAAIVALVAATAVIVVLAGSRPAQQYPADTPEGALQRYLASFAEGDYEATYEFFSEGVRTRMDFAAYERAIDAYGYHGTDGTARRILVERVSGSGDRRQVHLTVEEYYPDGLGGSTYRSEREIRTVRQPDGWRIDEPLVWLDPASLFEAAH